MEQECHSARYEISTNLPGIHYGLLLLRLFRALGLVCGIWNRCLILPIGGESETELDAPVALEES
jgi:hypothetical protein